MQIINDGKIHKLMELLLSLEVDDHTVISVYDPDGRMIARGKWYEDHILELTDDRVLGRVTGDRERVNFRMV